jgi:hypothetical protein
VDQNLSLIQLIYFETVFIMDIRKWVAAFLGVFLVVAALLYMYFPFEKVKTFVRDLLYTPLVVAKVGTVNT